MRGGKPHRVFLASRGKDVEAFCVAQAETGEALYEWAGANAGLHAILAHMLKTQKLVTAVYMPAYADPAADLFWNVAAWTNASFASLRIVNLDALLKSCQSLIEKRIPAGAGVRLVMTDGGSAQLGATNNATLALSRLAMTRLVFGPLAPSLQTALPDSLCWLDHVFPLPFALPASSHV